MANIVLDYAVQFSQVTSLPSPSLGFLKSVGVATPGLTANDQTVVLTTPSGTDVVAAVITLSGIFAEGSIPNATFTTDLDPSGFQAPFVVPYVMSAEELAIAWASFISGIPGVIAEATGTAIAVFANDGAVTVDITLASANAAFSSTVDNTTPIGGGLDPVVFTLGGYFARRTAIDLTLNVGSDTLVMNFAAPANMTAPEFAAVIAAQINDVEGLNCSNIDGGIYVFVDDAVTLMEITEVEVDMSMQSSALQVEVTDPTLLVEYTPNHEEIQGLFDGGLNKVTLILINDIAELTPAIEAQETEYYTVLTTVAFSLSGFVDATIGWSGVRGSSTRSQPEGEQYAIDNNMCVFYQDGNVGSSYNMMFAFGSLLSTAFWRNQQYIAYNSDQGAVKTLGLAESLFDDRLSFVISDDESGNRLGFFVAGGKSITTPYISKEIELLMQFEMTNFLTVNQPFNTAVERAELERIAGKQITEYIEIGYLDPDGVNEIEIRDSAEVFVVAGNLTTSPSVALWRVKIDAYQTQG